MATILEIKERLPKEFVNNLYEMFTPITVDNILKGIIEKRYTTLRVNTLKYNIQDLMKYFKEKNIKFERVLWYKDALIIKNANERDIKKLDIYEKGYIYIQSLPSMVPPLILEPKEGEKVLDLTAAPGSKTTQLASLMNGKGYILANELDKMRYEKLKYNVEKQGASCVYVMKKDSRQIDDFFSFDQILLDAPCSGSGILNFNNKNLNKHFSLELIDKSAKIQLALLRKAIKVLKKNQEMVYSTCSILSKENEEIVSKVMSENKLEIVPIEFEGIDDLPLLPTKIKGTLCVCPNELYEGFFIAKIRKL